MKIIRINNDIPIEWTVERFGKPEDFTGKVLKVYLVNIYGEQEIDDYFIKGNIIRFTFEGRVQKIAGKYGLKLVENPGQEGMYTIEECGVFCLTDSCVYDDTEDCNIEVKSNIMIPSNCLSAYEIAVKHGYKGSESEFAELFDTLVRSKIIRCIVPLTQLEWDALEVKDGNTMYVIMEDTGDAAGQR